MLVFTLVSLLATEPTFDLSGTLAQIDKQASRVSELASVLAQTAETGMEAGRPYGLAMMETDLASIQIHLRRLNAALAELEKQISSSP